LYYSLILDNTTPLFIKPHKKQGTLKDAKINLINPLKLLIIQKLLVFSFILFFFGFIILNSADAGFLSFLGKLLGSDETSPSQSQNSQNIPLLHAPLNSSLPAALGGGDITIVGQDTLFPDVGPEGSLADIKDKVPPDRISTYMVQEGDTLTEIAKMFGVSVNTILWANNIGRYDVLKVGQVITILPVPGIQCEVKAGDTIESIAARCKGDVNEIRQFNNLSPNHPLVVGMKLIVPDGEAPIPPSTNVPRGQYRGGSGPYYASYYIRPIVGGRKSQGLHGYNAVDLAAPCGTPILASHSGDVIMSRSGGWNGGYGNFIIIDHPNGTQTLYAHISSSIVGTGWHVVQGQVIGYIGVSGNTTGCHVHFEVRGAAQPI
jgi:murein DD-endopeptidase MepM/ murein hydrolase activator NlpD